MSENEKPKKSYDRDGKHWNKEEMDTLLEQHIDGESDKTIANVLTRRIESVVIKRTELMKNLIADFTKLDKNGLDEKGVEPGEGYYLSKDEYKKVLSIINSDLDSNLFKLLIKENLEKNAIMNVLFNDKVGAKVIQNAIDAAKAITDKNVEKRIIELNK
jgi:hypothetical protein